MNGMKNFAGGSRAAIALFLVALLAGCGGGGGGGGGGSSTADAASPSTTPGTTTPSTPSTTPPTTPAPDLLPALPASTRFAYSTSLVPGGVAVLAIDPDDGTPRVLATMRQVASGTRFGGMAADPQGRYLYINAGKPADAVLPLQAMTVNPDTGRFSGASTAAADVSASLLAISPFGDFAYVPDGAGGVRAFRIGAQGVFSEVAGSPFKGGPAGSDMQVKVHPSGKLVFLTVADGESFQSSDPAAKPFLVDRTTGALTPVNRSDPAPGGHLWLAGTGFVWVLNAEGLELLAVNTATGVLTRPAQRVLLPVDSAQRTRFTAAADATGKYLLVANGTSLQAYSVDAAAGTVTPIGTGLKLVGTSMQTALLRIDERTGRFYLADLVVQVDASTGVKVTGVSRVADENLALLPGAALTSFATYTYGIDPLNRVLRELSQDTATGALTVLSGSPRPIAGRPEAIALAPSGGFWDADQVGSVVAVASSNDAAAGTLSNFFIVNGGTLNGGDRISIAPNPTAVGIGWKLGPTGQGVYVAHAGTAGIDAAVAFLGTFGVVPGSPFPVAWGARSTHVDSNGRIVADPAAPLTIAAGVSDLLIPPGDVVFAAIPKDASGAGTAGAISTLAVASDLSLQPVATGSAACAVGLPAMGSTLSPAGNGTVGLASIGAGRLVYAVNRDSNNIVGYRAIGGLCFGEAWMPLTTGSPFTTAAQPVAIAADPAGRFLYVANAGGGGSISVYAVHPSTGTLTSIAGSPFALGRVPARIWTDVLGKFLYVADAGGSVTVQKLDRVTGVPGTPHAAAAGQPMTMGVSALLSAH
jgi:6-phosphogluconolactonase